VAEQMAATNRSFLFITLSFGPPDHRPIAKRH